MTKFIPIVQDCPAADAMKRKQQSFQEFVDAVQTADDVASSERVASRLMQRLGFRWFAYLRVDGDQSALISSYPKSWTGRYVDLRYQSVDPVIGRARVQCDLFCWSGDRGSARRTREQRRFFDEAKTFGIRSGITVPIRGGFGQMAAFTLATDESALLTERLADEYRHMLQPIGLYFHTHAKAKLEPVTSFSATQATLSQRERQCLAWSARGKTADDIAVLVGISKRTVIFHLENARVKLGAISLTQCVAEAIRRGLLP
jgi:LuxR family transcriptional regulator, activator of conjugal transfer of Ti plasmids